MTRSYLKQTYSKLKKEGRFLHHFNVYSGDVGIHRRLAHIYTEKELKNLFSRIKLKILDQFDNKPYKPGKWMRYVYGVKG